MPLRLRDNLHWCNWTGRAVFLDTQADLYFCLPKAANDAFLRLAARQDVPGDAQRLASLVARGMLIETDDCTPLRPPPLIPPPTSDLLSGQYPRTALAPVLRALASELHIVWLLRTKSFQDVLDAASNRGPRRRHRLRSDSRNRLQAIVAASAAAALVLRAHDRCVVRALAVHARCREAGINPKLVFGVIANPFTAHCWVQLGSTVLVGGFEQARLYTPILVLE